MSRYRVSQSRFGYDARGFFEIPAASAFGASMLIESNSTLAKAAKLTFRKSRRLVDMQTP
jgi:hypothetical protein